MVFHLYFLCFTPNLKGIGALIKKLIGSSFLPLYSYKIEKIEGISNKNGVK